MKRGREIYDGPVKSLENKEGTEKLRILTYKLCNLLYKKCYSYLSVKAAKRLMNDIADVCIEIKQLQVPDKAKPKKKEILDQAREKYRQLKEYTLTYVTEDEDKDRHQAQMVINYTVKDVLLKKGNYSGEDFRRVKAIIDDYSPMKGIRLKVIRELAMEIKEQIMKEYEL